MDHAAATPLDPRVKEAMEPYWSTVFGNPSAIHQEGVAARAAVEHSRRRIADAFGVHADEIVFTGSATESANLALIGAVWAWKAAHPGCMPHVVVSAIEHAAVLSAADQLETQGVRVTRIPVDTEGVVVLDALKGALSPDTVVVSVMHANNEIGTIQPIAEIAKVIRNWKREVRGVARDVKTTGDDRYPLLHTDAAQTVGFLPERIPALGVDLLTFSGAKIGGPKGIGALVVLRETPLSPMTFGGGQERGVRAGTENVPLIVGLAEALFFARAEASLESVRLAAIRDRLMSALESDFPDCIVNGSKTLRLPNNASATFSDLDHEFLTLALDARGIAVSTKSACNEWDAETSHVLLALREASGGSAAPSALRLSFGKMTTDAHADRFLALLREVLPLAHPS